MMSRNKNFNCIAKETVNCEETYSFHNVIPLHKAEFNPENFASKIKKKPSSGNVDEPEGSLDALLQVVS